MPATLAITIANNQHRFAQILQYNGGHNLHCTASTKIITIVAYN